jgi:tetratricopeptide (TPR) repeat protein
MRKNIVFLIIAVLFQQYVSYGQQHTKEYYLGIISYETGKTIKDPKNDKNYLVRGEVRYAINDKVNAFDDLNKAIELNQNNVEALFFRGYLFYLENKYDSAENDLKRVLKLKKKQPQAKAVIGIIEQLRQNYSIAIDYFNKSIKDSVSYTDSYYNLGLCYMSLGKYSMAINNFNQVIKLADEINAYVNKAYCFAKLKDFEMAGKTINIVYSKDSTNSTILSYMASIEIEKKEYKTACQFFDSSLKYGNKDAIDSLKKYCK